jgi:hypothetical protein
VAFTEAHRVQIRRWLGYSTLYLSADPSLEQNITAVQAVADGGSKPDASSELAVRSYLDSLEKLNLKLDELAIEEIEADTVDEVKIDAARGSLAVRSRMRLYVGHISDVLSVRPRRDVLSPSHPRE